MEIMTSIRETFQRIFSSPSPLPAGMYHYQAPPDDPRNYRLHLRIEPDGSGTLIINASTILHLNLTATEYAYYIVKNEPVEQVVKNVATRFKVSKDQARKDYQNLIDRIQSLVNTPDLDPETFLDFERKTPFGGSLIAPYRLDCALTYRLPSDEPSDSAPTDRVKRELTTAEWQTILDKAWAAGIPHVVFTGGEPTLREDIPDLIAHAEANSQVAGLISDGLRLAEPAYLDRLMQTGLDHLMLVLEPEHDATWTALQNVLEADLSVAVHLTLTPQNVDAAPALLERLAQAGVKAISLSSIDQGLYDALQALRNQVAHLNLELVWNLPVPYSAQNPIALETKEYGHTLGAGRAWLYVEPDGDVLPEQGINQVLGNFLIDPWEKIWNPGR
jgi:organic radical activating enzyme